MALQISISSPSSLSSSQVVSSGTRSSSMFCADRLQGWRSGEFGFARLSRRCGSERRRGAAVSVSASLEIAGAVAVVGQVTEVNKDNFWPIVNSAEVKAVVLDMYTQWCGPCKPLAKELGIKVVPTFKILKDGRVVKEVTGAKFDDLVAAIETVRSS